MTGFTGFSDSAQAMSLVAFSAVATITDSPDLTLEEKVKLALQHFAKR